MVRNIVLTIFLLLISCSSESINNSPDEPREKATLVYDAALMGRNYRDIAGVKLTFSRVETKKRNKVSAFSDSGVIGAHGLSIMTGGKRTGMEGAANFQRIELDSGHYVISHIEYIQENTRTKYCLAKQSILFDIEAGKVNYLGQVHLDTPESDNDSSLQPIIGINRDMKTAQNGGFWTFGDSQLSNISSVLISNKSTTCRGSKFTVAGWSGEMRELKHSVSRMRNVHEYLQ